MQWYQWPTTTYTVLPWGKPHLNHYVLPLTMQFALTLITDLNTGMGTLYVRACLTSNSKLCQLEKASYNHCVHVWISLQSLVFLCFKFPVAFIWVLDFESAQFLEKGHFPPSNHGNKGPVNISGNITGLNQLMLTYLGLNNQWQLTLFWKPITSNNFLLLKLANPWQTRPVRSFWKPATQQESLLLRLMLSPKQFLSSWNLQNICSLLHLVCGTVLCQLDAGKSYLRGRRESQLRNCLHKTWL